VPVSPEPFRGHEGVEQIVTAFRTAFPDISATIEEITQEEDRIVMQALIRGTNEGELMGTPPTGKSATWRVVHLGRIAGGKIAEDMVVFDQLGLLQQLGLAPVPEAARA
jgi:predicted ester cyclase